MANFTLLSRGKTPSGGETDERFVLRGRQGAPDVRVWPGLRIRRKWRLPDDSEIELENGVEEGDHGPRYYSKTLAKDGEPIVVKGYSASSVASELVKQLQGATGTEEDLRVDLSGPRFFGLRAPSIVK